MAYKIDVISSAKARITYFRILEYLEKNWTKREIIIFSKKTDAIIRAIQKNPEIFASSSKHDNIRKALIDKNNSLFYAMDKKHKKVFILTFFDNRQNPESLKFE